MEITRIIVTIMFLLLVDTVSAGRGDMSKMSSFVRSVAMRHAVTSARRSVKDVRSRELTAFVRIDGNADSVLSVHRCHLLERFGDICIAAIPLDALDDLSLSVNVRRIESGRSCMTLMDRVLDDVNVRAVHEGHNLPQAYTGRGVVMGIMDVGFDLTHPNFYDASAGRYRISRLWDQLSADTLGSDMYVGAEYVGFHRLLEYGHSRDGLKLTHGTHTAGTAAGGGYDSPYRGVAFDSDICLVSNAVTDDLEFISEADMYKYTYATDALGFKYIFDYAEAHDTPCVISFSEGSHQDLHGDDMLYYEVLERLVGPGRIIVASAGNEGLNKRYVHKAAGLEKAGAMMVPSGGRIYLTAATSDAGDAVRIVARRTTGVCDTLLVRPAEVLVSADGGMTDTIDFGGVECEVAIEAYPSCYDEAVTACDIALTVISGGYGSNVLSAELTGVGTADLYLVTGVFGDSSTDEHLCCADATHSIHSPSSSPAVICVGATAHDNVLFNIWGNEVVSGVASGGGRSEYSSVGPTLDGRVKPDVMAPGINVVSSYSSYFVENNPDAWDVRLYMRTSDFGGRTYMWSGCCGTSMSAPIVGGAIALWLEACPTLTPQDVLDVISRTARRIDTGSPVPNNQWGWGEIDVYAGLLDVLGLSSIDKLEAHHPQDVSIFPCDGGSVRIKFGTAAGIPVTVSVYDIDGRMICRQTLDGYADEVMVEAGLAAGRVYVVKVDAARRSLCGSTLVRAMR